MACNLPKGRRRYQTVMEALVAIRRIKGKDVMQCISDNGDMECSGDQSDSDNDEDKKMKDQLSS